jgi:hypothetical protein
MSPLVAIHLSQVHRYMDRSPQPNSPTECVAYYMKSTRLHRQVKGYKGTEGENKYIHTYSICVISIEPKRRREVAYYKNGLEKHRM